MKSFFVIIILSSFFLNLSAQDATRLCDTWEINQRAMKLNPNAKKAIQDLKDFTSTYKENGKQVYIIPVVFHVVHNYGTENISKEQILDAINVLNEDFRLRNLDTMYIVSQFKGIAADCTIEFRLAKIDPNGNCTDGIERIVSPLTKNANEDTKMAAPAWPRDKYLNVWTVASIESGAAGYSYYPGSVDGSWGEDVDGVLLLSNYLGSIGTSQPSHKRTLTHEIGHYLNLMHPWGNSNSPGIADNCYEDDEVTDTPNTIGHTTCSITAETCGSLDNVQNYMEYSYCGVMFTLGQRDRMHAALNSTTAERNNLWTTANLIATGTNDNYTGPDCIPVVDFKAIPYSGCMGYNVTFTDFSWNTDTISSYNWSFPGGNPASSNLAQPVVTYDTPGIYNVTLQAGNATGSASMTKTAYISSIDTTTGLNIPIIEGFENVTFPLASFADENWTTTKTGNYGWQRLATVSYSGTACLSVRNNGNNIGDESVLISPNILTDTLGVNAMIKFNLAYAKSSAESSEILRMFVSVDCGATWKLRYSRTAANLVTNGGAYVSNFIPTQSQWKEETVSLSTYSAYPHIMLKFLCVSGDGSRLYLDNINLGVPTNIESTVSNQFGLTAYPNPFEKTTQLEWISSEPEKIAILITDVTGKQVFATKTEAVEGLNRFAIDLTTSPKGIYFVKLYSNKESATVKLIQL
ncbi:MAG: hypothetical protein CVU05_00910 [Bacteroidetes bacterium HGW-Bacteroidetes-21]|jgi:PKD repeat protein|nr:MAG: hypothetical protein CVU05_00910 [Bacteroidetes bacterium HGW-Bacteroidetes-21]